MAACKRGQSIAGVVGVWLALPVTGSRVITGGKIGGAMALQQFIAAELLILAQIGADLAATVSVIGSGFANPQSAEFRRWMASQQGMAGLVGSRRKNPRRQVGR